MPGQASSKGQKITHPVLRRALDKAKAGGNNGRHALGAVAVVYVGVVADGGPSGDGER